MTIADYTGYILLAILFTGAWAPLLIDLLYKLNIVVKYKLMPDGMNKEFMKIHGDKSGTPAMGGLMIAISVFILTLFALPYSPVRTVFLLGWTLFAMYGVADGIIVYARKLSTKFKLLDASFGWRLGKLGVLYLLCLFILWVIHTNLGVTTISLLGLDLAVNTLSLLVGGFIMALAVYGMEITDGADGLYTGLILTALITATVVISLTGITELLPYAGVIVGSSLVYLYFNINPARVFMGGPGTFPTAFALIFFALLTNTLDIFIIVGAVFWMELISSFIQIISIRFFGRKVFRIAPIHHHFQAIGWGETKMVQRFWLAGIILAIIALWVFGVSR